MFKIAHQYYVYILSNKKNGTLYIGMTNDMERRAFEHKNQLVEGFTKKYKLDKLVYFESYQYVNDAILREKRMKKMETTVENQLNCRRESFLGGFGKGSV